MLSESLKTLQISCTISRYKLKSPISWLIRDQDVAHCVEYVPKDDSNDLSPIPHNEGQLDRG